MKRIAFCKINLTLEILGRARGDGFHDLKTVMHKIPLGDVLEIDAKSGNGNISFICDRDVCPGEDNLAYKAARMYLDLYEKNTGKSADVSIKLSKITPTGAGLGGGSADAACVLDCLYEILGGVSEDEVLSAACLLGSDVPFCLDRYTSAYCTGRGEVCREISRLPENISMLIAKPVQSINTKGIYAVYDERFGDDYSKSMSDGMEKALSLCDCDLISKCVMNDFEHVCIPRLPEISDIKEKMVSFGAICSSMSGSGSAVFGIFENPEKADLCKDAFLESGLKEVFVFHPEHFRKMYMGE